MTNWDEMLIDGGLIMLAIVAIGLIVGLIAENPVEALIIVCLVAIFLIASTIVGYLAHNLPEQIEKWR